MKFEVTYPSNETFCAQCGDQIVSPYLKLIQNRWAKPNLCRTCLIEFLRQIETGKLPDEQRRKIIVKYETISKNSHLQ
jgi:hypothetical protein